MEHGSLRESFILDTSLFVNPATQQRFGGGTDEAVRRFLELAGRNSLRLYMPVSIFRELSHFISPDVLARFRSASVVRAPNLHSLQVPAALFHTFIRDLRDRINRGLRVAEKALKVDDIPDKVKRPGNSTHGRRTGPGSVLRRGLCQAVRKGGLSVGGGYRTAPVLRITLPPGDR